MRDADSITSSARASSVGVQGLLDAWARTSVTDFPNYAAGSAGPEAADRLLARDKRTWLPIKANHTRARHSA